MTYLRLRAFVALTILAGVALFGGLLASAFTNDPVYFVVGYPASTFLLASAWLVVRL